MSLAEPVGAPLKVSDVSFKKGGHTLLSKVSFILDNAEVLGVISNRTEPVEYLFKLLLLLERPSSGSITYFNNPRFSRKDLSRRIGFYACTMDLVNDLTVLENFLLAASMHGMPKEKSVKRVGELLSLFEAANVSKTKWSRLALSVRRRLCFASTFIHDPGVILLYDPFRGATFDVASLMRNFIKTSADMGKSLIVFSTVPVLLDEICDRILIFHNGQQAVLDHTESFITGVSGPGTLSIHVSSFNVATNIGMLEKMGVSWYATGENEAIIELENTPEKIQRLLGFLVKNEAVINKIISGRQHLLESASRFVEE